MIQFKSKHLYSSKSNRWYPMITIGTYEDLSYTHYMYIFGDKIYKEHSESARTAFNAAKMWANLQ